MRVARYASERVEISRRPGTRVSHVGVSLRRVARVSYELSKKESRDRCVFARNRTLRKNGRVYRRGVSRAPVPPVLHRRDLHPAKYERRVACVVRGILAGVNIRVTSRGGHDDPATCVIAAARRRGGCQ